MNRVRCLGERLPLSMVTQFLFGGSLRLDSGIKQSQRHDSKNDIVRVTQNRPLLQYETLWWNRPSLAFVALHKSLMVILASLHFATLQCNMPLLRSQAYDNFNETRIHCIMQLFFPMRLYGNTGLRCAMQLSCEDMSSVHYETLRCIFMVKKTCAAFLIFTTHAAAGQKTMVAMRLH